MPLLFELSQTKLMKIFFYFLLILSLKEIGKENENEIFKALWVSEHKNKYINCTFNTLSQIYTKMQQHTQIKFFKSPSCAERGSDIIDPIASNALMLSVSYTVKYVYSIIPVFLYQLCTVLFYSIYIIQKCVCLNLLSYFPFV